MRTLAILVVLLSTSTGAEADAERRCTRLKVRAAMTYARAYHDCWAARAAAGDGPLFACLQSASATARAAVAAADAKGPCPGTPEQIANRICVPSLPASGSPSCRAAVQRAAGWKFARRLACHGNALRRREAPRPGCFERVAARFAQRIARANALGACGADASHLDRLLDRCVLGMATALSCGNARLDYGELCEGASDFCDARSCWVRFGGCCLTGFPGCFQFDGPIEDCFFNGGLDALPGYCTLAGACADDVPLSRTNVCCQQTGGGCSDGVAISATELAGLAACAPGDIAVVGSCGPDGRCLPSSTPPVALTTTSTSSTTTTTTAGETTTTTSPFPICVNIGGGCGSCGSGVCMAPFEGIPVGACVVGAASGPCADGVCENREFCIPAVDQCHALCF